MKTLLTTLTLLLGSAAVAQTTAPAPTTTPATAAPAPTATETAKTDPNALVARIGDRDITFAEFEQAFRIAVGRALNNQGMPFSEETFAEFAGARAEYLKQYVRDQALYQVAQRSVKLDTAALDAQVAEVKKKFSSDEQYQAALGQTGYGSEAAFREFLARQQVVGAYLDKLRSGFKFGDAFVASYYALHRADFERKAEACVKHILVPSQDEANGVADALKAGGDFAALAQEKSQDPGSAAEGGDLGCFGQGVMVPEFDKASFSGPVGQVQTVQSQFGWHLLVVTKRTDAGVLPLDQAAPLIRDQLAREAAQKYVDAQIAKIKVESFPDVLPAAPEQQ